MALERLDEVGILGKCLAVPDEEIKNILGQDLSSDTNVLKHDCMYKAVQICNMIGVVVTTLKCSPETELSFLGLDFTDPAVRKPLAKQLYFAGLLLPYSTIEKAMYGRKPDDDNDKLANHVLSETLR